MPKDSINQLMKNRNMKIFIGVLTGAVAMVFLFFAVTSPKNNKTKSPMDVSAELMSPVAMDFTDRVNKKAIENDQDNIDELKKQVNNLKKEFKDSIESMHAQQMEDKQVIADLQLALKQSQEPPSATVKGVAPGNQNALGNAPVTHSMEFNMQTVEFHYEKKVNESHDNKDIVTAGTFARAVLLSGADADASVNGQSNTDPILLRLLDDGVMPNGKHAHLKGCFVVASVYGDISSERGQVRTQRLSCVNKTGQTMDISVFGTVVGSSGKDGIRGIPVMRNGAILTWAGLSGFFSGVGQAMQQSQTTQSISALGTTNTIDASKTMQYGMYGGAGGALSKLADYYVKRADQYHPIIQINPGSIATVVFLKPFTMDFSVKPSENTDDKNTTSHGLNGDAIINSMNSIENNVESSTSRALGDHA
jgi:conjugal transfer pilus assembly protein TraB